MTESELFGDQEIAVQEAGESPTKGKAKGKVKPDILALPPLKFVNLKDIGARPMRLGFILRLREPVTHCDPGGGDKSNYSKFRREPMLRDASGVGTGSVSNAVRKLQERFPLPKEIAEDWAVMAPKQFLAAILFRACYNACYEWDADRRQVTFGFLRSAPDKANALWESVVSRLQQCATSSETAREFVAAVLQSVNVKTVESRHDEDLAAVYAMPKNVAAFALQELRTNAAMTVSDVRRWVKAEWVDGGKAETVVMEPLEFEDVELSEMEVIRVPEVSAVSMRHHIRAGCSRHLLEVLGLGSGAGEFSQDTERVLQNGGAMTTGSQQTKSDRIHATRKAFPMLDLLGGCLPDAMLGTAQLLVHTPRLVCCEYYEALPPEARALPQASAPAESQMGSRHYARAASLGEPNGMPYGREVLLEGAVISVEMTVRPYTTLATLGALVAGCEDWWEKAPGIGGAQANGFGQVEGQWLFDGREYTEATLAESRAAYEEHITTNAEALTVRLRSGQIDAVQGV